MLEGPKSCKDSFAAGAAPYAAWPHLMHFRVGLTGPGASPLMHLQQSSLDIDPSRWAQYFDHHDGDGFEPHPCSHRGCDGKLWWLLVVTVAVVMTRLDCSYTHARGLES